MARSCRARALSLALLAAHVAAISCTGASSPHPSARLSTTEPPASHIPRTALPGSQRTGPRGCVTGLMGPAADVLLDLGLQTGALSLGEEQLLQLMGGRAVAQTVRQGRDAASCGGSANCLPANYLTEKARPARPAWYRQCTQWARCTPWQASAGCAA